MANNETALMHKVLAALSEAGCLVFRSNTGTAWQGQRVYQDAGTVTLSNSRMITFGLCVGASDIIGIVRGRFLAVEIKTDKGSATKEQLNFIDAVNAAGGIAGVVRSVEEALQLIREN